MNTRQFQSTLPRGERLVQDLKECTNQQISIHAPARGATVRYRSKIHCIPDFNPRSREGSDKIRVS